MLRQVGWSFLLAGAVFLGACGGGSSGGAGGGGGDRAAPQSISLQGAEAPLEKAGVQTVSVTNLPLENDVYEGEVGGTSVPLARTVAGDLVMLLPPSLSAGSHVLSVTIEGKHFEVPFEVAESQVASRAESLAGLDSIFSTLRAAMDDAITEMTSAGAPQPEIDAKIAQRDLLDTTDPLYASLTDAELDYLHDTLSLIAAEKSFAARGLLSQACKDALAAYWVKLGASAALTGLGAAAAVNFGWLSATPVGIAVGIGISALLIANLDTAANAWANSWDACVNPITNNLQTDLSRSLNPEGMPRELIINDETGSPISYTSNLPERYSLGVEFDIPEDFYGSFPEIRTLVNKFSIIIPDKLENYILERTVSEYSETVPSSLITISDISAANVDGDLSVVNETDFTLEFQATGPFSGDPVFTFALNDLHNNIQTIYKINLEMPEHCPVVTEVDTGVYLDLINVCINVHLNSEGLVEYSEYTIRMRTLHEIYQPGEQSLKVLKNLQDYDKIDDYLVDGAPVPWMASEGTLVYEDDEYGRFFYTVRSRDIWRYPDETGPYVYVETIFSDPVYDQANGWQTFRISKTSYRSDGGLLNKSVFFEPFRDVIGEWQGGVLQQDQRYYPDGQVEYHCDYSLPVEAPGRSNNIWDSAHTQCIGYYADGSKQSIYYYSDPLLSDDGIWVESTHTRQYEYALDGTISDEWNYTQPLKRSNGRWMSVWSNWIGYNPDGTFNGKYYYSEPLLTGDGDFQSVAVQVENYDHGTLTTRRHYDIYQNSDGYYYTRIAKEEDHVNNCYTTYDSDGSVAESTCVY